jgi:hypothetical protein
MAVCGYVVGVVSTLAGSGSAAYGDGVGATASFRNPRGIAVSSNGIIFVADSDNHRVRMIASSNENI